MKKFLSRIYDVFFPHRCSFCDEILPYDNQRFICDKCIKTIDYITGPTCLKCGSPREEYSLPVCLNCRKYRYSFAGSFTPLKYKDKTRKALLRMKFRNKTHFAYSFAYLICNNIVTKDYPDFDFITYIPLSRERFNERGYNQAEIIAFECGKILNVPVISTLTRKDGTPNQHDLPLKERHRNAKNSFFPKDMKLNGTALLIDDIYTTGSTMDYCSSLLLKMGCDKVYIACLALTVKE
ncbi:MAG: ComF family protein [Clostridia bacterium]